MLFLKDISDREAFNYTHRIPKDTEWIADTKIAAIEHGLLVFSRSEAGLHEQLKRLEKNRGKLVAMKEKE